MNPITVIDPSIMAMAHIIEFLLVSSLMSALITFFSTAYDPQLDPMANALCLLFFLPALWLISFITLSTVFLPIISTIWIGKTIADDWLNKP